MSHLSPSVLIFYPDICVVERLCSLLDECGLDAAIVPVVDAESARDRLSASDWSLGIFPLFDNAFQSLVSLHSPGAVFALAGAVEDAVAMRALRSGAVNLFHIECLDQPAEAEAFKTAVSRHLSISASFNEKERYRKQLELSLAELKTDQKAALHIQKNMLPSPEAELLPGISVSFCLTPSLYLSGDFLDYVSLSPRFAMFYLADVSGHGASSALVTVLLKNLANRLERNFKRGSSFDILSPEAVLQRVNRELLETGLGKHLTMFVGLIDLDSSRLRYSVGGHYPMPVLCTAGGARMLAGRGMPVGLFEEPAFDVEEIELPSVFSLSLCSDGVFEMIPAENLREKERLLCDAVECLPGVTAERLQETLVPDGIGGAPDDIAIMVLERR